MPIENTTRAGHTSILGRDAGMEAQRPWPASPGALTAIRTNIPK